jgi:hypothetical protein
MCQCRLWTGIRAKQVSNPRSLGAPQMLMDVVVGENESEILNLIKQISKEKEKA